MPRTMTRGRYLLVYSAAAIAMIVASVALAIIRPPFEQVILVNDTLNALRVDQCSLDGEAVRPGMFRRPIDVSASMACPVYVNRDASYVGCLLIRRQKQHGRRIAIMANTTPGISVHACR